MLVRPSDSATSAALKATLADGRRALSQLEFRTGNYGEDKSRGRQDSPSPSCIEAQEGDPPTPFSFFEQEAGDEETGDHEEDVDTDVASLQRRQAYMVQHDQ